MESVKKSIGERAQHKMEYESRVNERLMQTTEEKVDSSKALDAKYRTISDEEPMAEAPFLEMLKRRLIAADQASVFMAMMSDHNSSVLAPHRQEMSVKNVSSGLVPQGQKASDYDNLTRAPKYKMLFLQQSATD
ncbi:hypothetical protein Tco_0578337 [Tanacetum coccineum]